jgi:hypothetical protein
MGQFGFDGPYWVHKHKVLRFYAQAEENACSFTGLRMTNLGVGEIEFKLTHYVCREHSNCIGGVELQER